MENRTFGPHNICGDMTVEDTFDFILNFFSAIEIYDVPQGALKSNIYSIASGLKEKGIFNKTLNEISNEENESLIKLLKRIMELEKGYGEK